MIEIEDQKSVLLLEFIDAYVNGASEEEMQDIILRSEKILKAEGWDPELAEFLDKDRGSNGKR